MNAAFAAAAILAATAPESMPNYMQMTGRLRRRKRSNGTHHGRWIVLYYLVNDVRHPSLRVGRRFASLSAARAFARRVQGSVRHYRKREWVKPSSNPWERATINPFHRYV